MSTNGETADLMVREGIQITESALKLAGLGAKNLAALLIALANDNQKLAGKTNLKRLIHDGEELTIFSVKQEDLKGFQMEAKRYQQRRDEYGNEEYILGCIMVKGDAFPKEVIAHAFVEDMGLELQFQIWRDEPRIRQKQAMWYDLTLFDVERDFFGRLEQG